MSTQTQTSSSLDNLKGLPQPKVQEQPNIALTGRITKIGEAVTTKDGEGDYDAIELIVEPTNSSRKISFIKMYVRPEYFSFGQLNPEDMYVTNPRNAYFAEQKEGTEAKPRTNGESFAASYGMNVMPSFGTNKDGSVRVDPKTGKAFMKKMTHVVAISGGALESFGTLVGKFTEAVAKNGKPSSSIPGLTELTSKQIVDLLNEFLQSRPQQELVFTARQSKRDGEFTDNYEFNQWEGLHNQETYNRLSARAEKTKNEEGAKKLVIRYNV